MTKKTFIFIWGRDNEEFLKDLNSMLENEMIKKHAFVIKDSRPEICSTCRKQINAYNFPTNVTKKHCPICNEKWIF